MKLVSLKLCNFRQFYGKTPEIYFANDRLNTTIIHGNNGSGKTTLLNAFTWVLYETFTAAFSSPELLVNKRAIEENDFGVSVECWVEIIFDREHKRYQVKRKCYACRDRNDRIQYSKSQLFMLIAGDDGRWYHPLQQPEEIINRILPASLHQYFFFDGERIDRFFRDGKKTNIAEDTKELLGVKVLDRSLEHLKKAKRSLEEELKIIGDVTIKKHLQQQKKLEQELENLQQEKDKIIQESEDYQKIKQEIAARLLELSGAEELQLLKQQLSEQEKSDRKILLEGKRQLKQSISSFGQTILLANAIAKFDNIVRELRNKGELSSGIKQEFVAKLLTEETCICGNSILQGTENYERVKKLLDRAGNAEIEETAIRIETQVKAIEKQSSQFWQRVDRDRAKINRSRTEIARIENQLDEIDRKLRNYPSEDIQKLQQKLDEIEANIREITLKLGAIGQKKANITAKLQAISKEINKHQIKQEKQALARKRIKITGEAIERLIEVRSRLERQFRISLEQKVKEIFSTISFTPYIPRLSENYELTLVENTSGIALPVAASTGENQILSLSFIGGIIDRVREWSEQNTLMGPDSSKFPIVMDSPFGSLDEIYRTQVAKAIPQLANQLIVLVTNTQWRGEVASEMSKYIHSQYILVYNSPKPNCTSEAIEINGKTYPLIQQSPNRFEYTEIIRVS
ncbi:MAG: AAA family ATPase [Prochloraceae cyanobacterium]|nr:AAA family ATPase [Prochloraceae cyanobacterium]